jgi:hypothetical protein
MLAHEGKSHDFAAVLGISSVISSVKTEDSLGELHTEIALLNQRLNDLLATQSETECTINSTLLGAGLCMCNRPISQFLN